MPPQKEVPSYDLHQKLAHNFENSGPDSDICRQLILRGYPEPLKALDDFPVN